MPRVYHGSRAPSMFRPRTGRAIAGVCAGFARHFSFSVVWVRIFFILGFIFQAPLAVVLYIVSIFLMPSEPRGLSSPPSEGHEASLLDRAQDRPLTADLAREMLCLEFEDIESRLRLIEDHVTSKEFVLRQKFKDL